MKPAQEKTRMKIDLELLTECALRVLAGMEARPFGAALLIGVLLSTAAIGFAWR